MSQLIKANYKPGTLKAIDRVANHFHEWRGNAPISEEGVLHYFEKLSAQKVASTLWTEFSLLKRHLLIDRQIDLGKAPTVVLLLKSLEKKHIKKQSQCFSREELFSFFKNAPNIGEFLIIKLVASIGFYCTARTCEIWPLCWEDFKITPEGLLVHIIRTKTDATRTGEWQL
jgi:hypothetical protein